MNPQYNKKSDTAPTKIQTRNLVTELFKYFITNEKFINGYIDGMRFISSSSLPASNFGMELALHKFAKNHGTNLDQILYESNKKIYSKNLRKRKKFPCYVNGKINYIGEDYSANIDEFSTELSWADYCSCPNDLNMQIGCGTKAAFATFNISNQGWRSVDLNLPYYAKLKEFINPNLTGKSCHSDRVKAIKSFYEKYYPDYKILISIRYRSNLQEMLLIGLIKKGLTNLKKLSIVKTLENNSKSEKLTKYINELKEINMITKTKNVREVAKSMLENGFSESEVCMALDISKGTLRAYKAWITMKG